MIAIVTTKQSDSQKWVDLYETLEQAVEQLIEEHSITNHSKLCRACWDDEEGSDD